MKRTSTMKFNETVEARELYLCAEKEYSIYKAMQAVRENLTKKVNKGIYNSDKAIDAFYPVMTMASNAYNKDFGYRFSVQDRFTAAVYFVQDFEMDNNL